MFIVVASPLRPRSSGAQGGHARATFDSAGAEMNFSGRGYKHLVPPGLEQSSNNTLLPTTNRHGSRNPPA